jgi:hypothetical protein
MGSDGDEAILRLLRQRDGRLTKVVLGDGRTLAVFNIAWGHDVGDSFAHVTTNISPSVEGADIDVFTTDSVVAIIDPATGTALFTISA